MKHSTREGNWLQVKRRASALWSTTPWSAAHWKSQQAAQQQGVALSTWEDEGGTTVTAPVTTATPATKRKD